MVYYSAALALQPFLSKKISIKSSEHKNNIKGGWAGQTMGVTFSSPVKFKFNGTMIGLQQPLEWYDGYLKKNMIENPGMYHDLNMDLTFV